MAWWYGRRRQQVVALVGLLFLLCGRVPAANEAILERMRKDITFLASDECEGRGVNTKGINLAADYIAKEFKQAGLKPVGTDGSYFQPFTMRNASRLGSPNTLSLRGPLGQQIELNQGQHFLRTRATTTMALSTPPARLF